MPSRLHYSQQEASQHDVSPVVQSQHSIAAFDAKFQKSSLYCLAVASTKLTLCIYKYKYIYIYTYVYVSEHSILFSSKKKKCPQGERYNIYTWLVRKEKITMHICMFTYMHRRMGTICFLSKSQNFFTLPLAQKWFLQKEKRRTQQLRLKGVICHGKYNIYTQMAKRKG